MMKTDRCARPFFIYLIYESIYSNNHINNSCNIQLWPTLQVGMFYYQRINLFIVVQGKTAWI